MSLVFVALLVALAFAAPFLMVGGVVATAGVRAGLYGGESRG